MAHPLRYILIDTNVFRCAYDATDEASWHTCRRAWYHCFSVLVNQQLTDEYMRHVKEIGYSSRTFELWCQRWSDAGKLEWIEDSTDEEVEAAIERDGFLQKYREDLGLILPTIRFQNTHRDAMVYFVTNEGAIVEDGFRLENLHKGASIKVKDPESFANRFDDAMYCTSAPPPILSQY